MLIVHLNVTLDPIVNPVTPLVEEDGVVIVAVPLTIVHTPVPDTAALPESVVVLTLHRF